MPDVVIWYGVDPDGLWCSMEYADDASAWLARQRMDDFLAAWARQRSRCAPDAAAVKED